MVLTNEQIKSITVGAPFIVDTDEGLKFYKYCPELYDVWKAHREVLAERMLATSGVRLDFSTNSKHLTIELEKPRRFEIFINGVFRYTMREQACLSVDIDTPFGESLDEARITVYFPAHSVATVKSVELDDGAFVVPYEFDRKILFIGDSITQGYQAEFESFSYANRVSRHFNAESVVQGIGGACFFADCLEPIPFDPDWVIIAYGTNDFRLYDTLDEFKSNLYPFMSKLANMYSDKKIFVISPVWRADQTPKKEMTFKECREAIIEEAKKYGFAHIDGAGLIPPMACFYTDGVHPNDNGFSIMAENIIREIEYQLKN